MGFRRSPDRISAARDWQRFVENNTHVISAAAVPPAATVCIENWNDFLTHGYLAGDPGQFTVDQLAPPEYQSLVELVSNYFDAGYEFYAPMALSAEDRAALNARFAAGMAAIALWIAVGSGDPAYSTRIASTGSTADALLAGR